MPPCSRPRSWLPARRPRSRHSSTPWQLRYRRDAAGGPAAARPGLCRRHAQGGPAISRRSRRGHAVCRGDDGPAPWELWTHDGKAEPGTEEILTTLERVLETNPNIRRQSFLHSRRGSVAGPSERCRCATRLGGLMPGAGHLVHMPAHIFFRLGRYHDASEANERAIEADEAYHRQVQADGPYPMMYYPHNIHFLWAALTMEGRASEAIRRGQRSHRRRCPTRWSSEMPMIEAFVPTRLYALVRFGKLGRNPAGEAARQRVHVCHGHLALCPRTGLGRAKASRGRGRSQANCARSQAAMPEDKMAMQHHARDLLAIAVNHLDATLMARRGQMDAAVEKLQPAVAQQDALQYDEPPPWYLPMRQPLGACCWRPSARPRPSKRTATTWRSIRKTAGRWPAWS